MGHENCFSNWRDHTSSAGMGSCLGDRALNTFQLSSDWLRVARVFVDRVKLTQVSSRDLVLLGSFLFAIVSGQCLNLR